MVETRAYFPSREEAERFARQFDAARYDIAIAPEPRQGRQVFQVHVVSSRPTTMPPATDLLKLVGQVGDHARKAGLQGDQLGRRMGHALGEALALKQAKPGMLGRREAVQALGPLFDQCGLGSLSVVSATPFVLRVQAPLSIAPEGKRCAHVAGFLEGSLGALLGQAAQAKELDCTGLGNAYCTFVIRV